MANGPLAIEVPQVSPTNVLQYISTPACPFTQTKSRAWWRRNNICLDFTVFLDAGLGIGSSTTWVVAFRVYWAASIYGEVGVALGYSACMHVNPRPLLWTRLSVEMSTLFCRTCCVDGLVIPTFLIVIFLSAARCLFNYLCKYCYFLCTLSILFRSNPIPPYELEFVLNGRGLSSSPKR